MKLHKKFFSFLLTVLSMLCLVFAFDGCNPPNINAPQLNLPVLLIYGIANDMVTF